MQWSIPAVARYRVSPTKTSRDAIWKSRLVWMKLRDCVAYYTFRRRCRYVLISQYKNVYTKY